MIAKSLNCLLKAKKDICVEHIILNNSADLICNNLWCEKVTKPCICRLERVLETANLTNIRTLELVNNGLEQLPPSIEKMKQLRVINLSNNNFTRIPSVLSSLPHLENIIMIGNPIEDNSINI